MLSKFVCQVETEHFNNKMSLEDYDKYINQDKFMKIYSVDCNKQIVGYLIVKAIDSQVDIHKIYVSDDHRNKGYASKLIKIMKEDVKANEYTLEVRRSNQEAINFYKKCNFEIVSTRKNYYKSPVEDGLLMYLREE